MAINISLQPFNQTYLKDIWKAGFTKEHPNWIDYNAPYFDDYIQYPNFIDFKTSSIADFLLSSDCKAIIIDSKAIGMVSKVWINKQTRWLEIGIVIYNSDEWKQGIGSTSLSLWITNIFKKYLDLEHIGLTTWSGNKGMMHLAQKLNFKKEGQIRKVRYYDGVYYDSLNYGILRSEWDNFIQK